MKQRNEYLVKVQDFCRKVQARFKTNRLHVVNALSIRFDRGQRLQEIKDFPVLLFSTFIFS